MNTQTPPDGTKSVQSYSDGLLSEAKRFDNAGTATAPGNLVASMSYTYDSHGRLATTTDSRTGTTTMGSYTDSGNLLSITDSGSRTTSFTYDVMGRRLTVDAPNTTFDNITRTSYYPTGQVKAQWGDQTNAVFYDYDAQNRQVELRTYQSLAHGTEPTAETAGAATTTWTYSPTRGFLTRRQYADTKGTDYTYTASGRLATRTWARGTVTTYTYDAGRLVHTNYSDTTPDVTVAYDSFGRQTSVTNGVATTTYAYDPATLVLDTETISYDLDADSTPDFTRVIDRSQDTLKRDNGWQLKDGATIENEVTYAYDITGRLGSVTSGAGTFTYAYQANSTGLLHTVTGPAHTVTNSWEATRDVLTLKENKVGTTTISSYGYGVNEIRQRTDVANVATTGSAFASTRSIAWGYDALGQVAKADSSITGFDRAYEYDGIGNRKEAADSLTLTDIPNYVANALNQYTHIGSIEPTYDLDGNATAYPVPAYLSANSVLEWDAENRLISATVDSVTTTYHYDSGSRRIFQKTGSTTTVYVYDGWNPMAEYSGTTLAKTYTWGLDLSGSLQGAGGVGGLLAVTDEAATGTPSYFPTFDGNGNVSEYLDGTGAIEAHYEYDPFGRTTVASGAKAADFAHRFSTKPIDSATGLLYYGYRYYDPMSGRWPSRDPIEERGGANLYGFLGNNGINNSDRDGLLAWNTQEFLAVGIFTPGDSVKPLNIAPDEEVMPSDKLGITLVLLELNVKCKCTYESFFKSDHYLESYDVYMVVSAYTSSLIAGDSVKSAWALDKERDHETDFRNWAKGDGRNVAQGVENVVRGMRFGSDPECRSAAERALAFELRKSFKKASDASKAYWDNGRHDWNKRDEYPEDQGK